MNSDELKGNWNILKGKARQQWGDLTDDEVEQVAGDRDELIGRIQKTYGIAREEAERQVDGWKS
ncbi:MAG: CsbD family protein [Rhodospirillales bacterium]